MRVLVVEDEKSVASLISKSLVEQGFDVDVEENGDVACERALSEPFDAIVLDIMLPGRDGLSVLRVFPDSGSRGRIGWSCVFARLRHASSLVDWYGMRHRTRSPTRISDHEQDLPFCRDRRVRVEHRYVSHADFHI